MWSHSSKLENWIYKNNNNSNCFLSENYRAVTLTNTIAKICEAILAKRFNEHLETNKPFKQKTNLALEAKFPQLIQF